MAGRIYRVRRVRGGVRIDVVVVEGVSCHGERGRGRAKGERRDD
jgi:hypothetical protein